MALPITIPFTFGNATTTQSLSSLDTNFTTITNSVNGLTNGASQINVASISATGTANATTYLRGDGAWATVSGGGGSGTVTSINANSTIGFTFTGGPVTTSGTLTLSGPTPGTSGNVLTSNGTAWVSQVNSGSGLGVGQTWTNVSSSRSIGVSGAAGTTYTNNTGKPIYLSVYPQLFNGSTYIDLYVGGVLVARSTQTQSTANQYAFVTAIVPDGSSYYASTNSTSVTITNWYELR